MSHLQCRNRASIDLPKVGNLREGILLDHRGHWALESPPTRAAFAVGKSQVIAHSWSTDMRTTGGSSARIRHDIPSVTRHYFPSAPFTRRKRDVPLT